MKRNNRIFLLVTMIIIALVIGSFVLRQVEMLPYEVPLSPSPFPTVPINPTITVTIEPELILLSPLLGNVLLETASAGEGTKITPIGTLSATLCTPSDVACSGENITLNPQQQVYQLMASAEVTEYAQLALTATALATSPTPTEHISVTATATSTPTSQQASCAFSWAHQDVPEAATAARKAFNDAGVTSIGIIQVDAFGENCLDANGKIVSFGSMGSDFYLTASVNNLDDVSEMAQIVKTAYATLMTLTVKLPGGRGYLDITMSTNGTSKHFRALFDQVKAAIDAGKSGAELLAVGGL